MSNKTITMLPIDKIRVVKQILIVAEFANGREFSIGYILYERLIDREYRFRMVPEEEKDADYRINYPRQSDYPSDEIDKVIIDAIQDIYPKSFVRNYSVVFNVEEDKIKVLQSRQFVPSHVWFVPNLSQVDIYSSLIRSFPTDEKEIRIYNEYKLEEIMHLAFTVNYSLNQPEMLKLLSKVNFL